MQRCNERDFSTRIYRLHRLKGWLFKRSLRKFALTHSSPPAPPPIHVIKVFAIPRRNGRKLHWNRPLITPAFPEENEKIKEFSLRWPMQGAWKHLLFFRKLSTHFHHWTHTSRALTQSTDYVSLTGRIQEIMVALYSVLPEFLIEREYSNPSEAVYRYSWLLLETSSLICLFCACISNVITARGLV